MRGRSPGIFGMEKKMNKKVRNTVIIVLAVIVAAAAAYFVYTSLGKDAGGETSAETAIEQDTSTAEKGIDENDLSTGSTNPEAEQLEQDAKTDNTELAQQIMPSTAMEEVINANASRLTQDVSGGSTSYPGNFIPLYDLAQLGDVSDIVTSGDKAGWKLSYGSDSTVEDISAFYEALLDHESGYAVSGESGTTKIAADTGGYAVTIEVSPNNPEQTGLNYKSDVSVMISAQ